MKRFKMMTAALCAVVLLCGFSATAYAGGGEEYEEETGGYELWEGVDPVEALPVQTIEPTENAFTTSGTGTVVDNATDEDGKEFFTIITADESVFYLVIDRQKSSENVYFLNAVTVADLLALAESSGEPIAVTSPEPETEPTVTTEPEPAPVEETETSGGAGMILLALAVVLIGGGAAYYFKIHRPKQQRAADAENDYGGELDTYGDMDDYDGGDDADDDGPPWDDDEGDDE